MKDENKKIEAAINRDEETSRVPTRSKFKKQKDRK